MRIVMTDPDKFCQLHRSHLEVIEKCIDECDNVQMAVMNDSVVVLTDEDCFEDSNEFDEDKDDTNLGAVYD